ncbi:MAG: hypothetical protein ACRCYY_04665 [Trueperaceae bacterium]
MKRWFYVLFSLVFLGFSQAQSPEMLQETLTDPSEIVTLIREAKTTLFLASPVVSDTLEQELVNAVSKGITVYLVTPESNPRVQALADAQIQVKTLESFTEGILLVDTTTLIVGGLLSGTSTDTLKIDVSLYGATVLEQLRPVWQIAKPIGG